jgi:hypothetical protein
MLAFKRFPSLTRVIISMCRFPTSTVLINVYLYLLTKMLGYLIHISVVRISKH